MSFYAKLIKEKPYCYAQHLGPHDLDVQEFGSGRTRLEVARELGIDFTLAPRLPVEEGIEAVQNLLPQLWIDRTKCARGVEALQHYHYSWDETLRIFSKRPFHSWSSHGADALRTFATGYDELPDSYAPRPPVVTAFDPYTGKARAEAPAAAQPVAPSPWADLIAKTRGR